jgi:GPI ethanolamine phosphate transferase 2/3 subunit F
VTSHIPETALCAAHAAFLVAPQLVYTLGIDGERWRDVLSLMRPMDEVMGAAVGTMLGAWVGAVPIPLDW